MFGSAVFAAITASASAPAAVNEFTGSHVIELVESRANEVAVPAMKTIAGAHTRLMAWSDVTNAFVAAATPTRVSEFVKQVNKRVLGSSVMTPVVIQRIEAIDADTGDRFSFTPGATVVGSIQDFEVIIADQLGGYESRGFTIFLAVNANPSPGIDSGQVLLRLTPAAFPW